MEKIKAKIEEAMIYKISDLWARKPKMLKFNDTDAIVVTLRTEDGSVMRETFYFCLKPDGTFNVQTISKDGSHVRRLRLANFLKHYGMTDDVRHYNLKENIDQWKGKEVLLAKSKDTHYIYVPMRS